MTKPPARLRPAHCNWIIAGTALEYGSCATYAPKSLSHAYTLAPGTKRAAPGEITAPAVNNNRELPAKRE